MTPCVKPSSIGGRRPAGQARRRSQTMNVLRRLVFVDYQP